MSSAAGLAASSVISALSEADTAATWWSASLGFITRSAANSTDSGRLVFRQSTVYARDADASMLAPITSVLRVMRKEERLAVARNAMLQMAHVGEGGGVCCAVLPDGGGTHAIARGVSPSLRRLGSRPGGGGRCPPARRS